jgi:peptide/nickel transport system substrate-binding protein
MSQLLNRHSRHAATCIAIVATAATAVSCRPSSGSTSITTKVANGASRGGAIVASIRTEPRSFNRLVARDTSTALVAILTQSKLVRVNQATQEVEPGLAESWTISGDGRRATLKLRKDVNFSDGHPFTADDVLFTFEAAYNREAASVMADTLQVAHKNLQVKVVDPHTIEVTFPEPFAPGVRLLDNLPILPRHKLEASLRAGTFATAWSLSTPVSELAGLGPFVLSQYVPGQRLVFDRNPHFFLKADDGTALPYLDRITVEIIPDQGAELLRLEAGQIDMMTSEIAPDSYAPLKRAADTGRVKLLDLGVGYNANGLWFNLKPGAIADARAPWLQSDALRRAISMAVDRQLFVNTVYLGAGVPVYGSETPANRQWYWTDEPKTPYDPEGAKKLLASIGLVDRNGDGVLDDARNEPARFTLMTQKGRPDRERAAFVIRDELKKIGVQVDAVALDAGVVIQGFLSAKYDAVFMGADKTDLDPAVNPDFWLSSGGAHVWNIASKTPATDWERRIDDLMARQIAAPEVRDRKRLYDEMQKIFAEHLPVVYFAAPRIYVALSSRLINIAPGVLQPQLLWAPERVAVTR